MDFFCMGGESNLRPPRCNDKLQPLLHTGLLGTDLRFINNTYTKTKNQNRMYAYKLLVRAKNKKKQIVPKCPESSESEDFFWY